MLRFLKKLFSHKDEYVSNDEVGRIFLKKAIGLANEKNNIDALLYFDKAVSYGIKEAYPERAYCLQILEYHIEAIQDFTTAISFDKQDSNLYYGRALSCKSMFWLEKAKLDYEKAIELAKLKSSLNDFYNQRALEMGYTSVSDFYQMYFDLLKVDISFYSDNPDLLKKKMAEKEVKVR